MNKQQLASTIWESANQMRSKIEANEYKDFILGFIFYKYLSEKEVAFFRKERLTDADIEKVTEDDVKYAAHVRENLGYFIAYENLFSTWLKKGNDFDISNVRDALSAYDRNIDDVYRKVFEKIFNTLQTGLSKLGETAQAQTKAVKNLLKLIRKIPMDGKQDYDILGFIYEYLISMFAANAGKKAGEFYTPHEVSVLMSEIIAEHLKNRKQIKIYDPTSGSGSLLINIGNSVAKFIEGENKIDYYAQELKENTYNLTRMNLVMRGISPANINVRNGDTLEDDWPFFEDTDKDKTYKLIRVDAVVSNPPYSQKWDPSNKEFDARYKNYGIAPKSKADYAFLLHDLYHLEDDGIMTIVLPHGVLFRGGDEGKIRENLIEKNNVDTIIGLPANIFFGTGIPTIIMVLKRKRSTSDVLIIDASKGFEKVGKNNKLRACDIKKIADTVKKRETIENYSALVSKKTIRENDYNLNIPRYVNSSEPVESWDIHATMFGGIPVKEVAQLHEYWDAFPGLQDAIFEKISAEYLTVKCEDIKATIASHESLANYKNAFTNAFSDFYEELRNELIEGILDVSGDHEKEKVSDDIFSKIGKVKLADKYKAYQILSNHWDVISTDLEMIQSEGFEVINQVDPNMVAKKKEANDDEIPEVQDGWKGHILPFDLVQREILTEDLEELQAIEKRLTEITSLYAEIIDSLDEEEKESSVLNETSDTFVAKEVKSFVAEALCDVENDEIKALKGYLSLSKKKEKLDYIKKCDTVSWGLMEQGSDGTYKKGSVSNRISELQRTYEFPEDSFEYKVMTVLSLMEEESQAKKEVKQKWETLHIKTKETIEKLGEDESLRLLELKWIKPLVDSLFAIPDEIIGELIKKVIHLHEKYCTTFSDIEHQIEKTSVVLSNMIDELGGNDSDIEGLEELKKILGVH
ncbi:type I restriction-modification system subunit M [Clostridium sporogenes]|uniref:type I restriction-modification system subunit M n=1 Tax=Clostridium sporogenes TaxID=1509 RepID=UPI0013D65B02|nr:type I restriction-modification system subunit M [Clostridium sporogenes]NFL76218.1 type I restriction-modification system subunit M [Clostridium sporogenes]